MALYQVVCPGREPICRAPPVGLVGIEVALAQATGIPICQVGTGDRPDLPEIRNGEIVAADRISVITTGVASWYQAILNRRHGRTGGDGGVLDLAERRLLEGLVAELIIAVYENTWQLEAERLAEVDLLVKGLSLQLHSPSPRRSIVKATLRVLGDLLVGVSGNLLAAKLQWF